jgi:hypothetical protein
MAAVAQVLVSGECVLARNAIHFPRLEVEVVEMEK